jgi:hypothetical protein
MEQADWLYRFNTELNAARQARADGNEGRARVCARRALGLAVREYYQRNGEDLSGTSIYQAIAHMAVDPVIPGDWVELVKVFMLRANPDGSLPIDVDLVDQAERFTRLAGLRN